MQKKIAFLCCLLGVLSACSEHDPILPGTRTAIFDDTNLKILNQDVPDLPEQITAEIQTECPYTQDSSNVIWKGDRKIFSGFPTSNSVKSNQSPVCSNGYVYAGLTTGELVKVNPTNRKIIWIADIYKTSNMTGGASILDIIAPVVIKGNYVYAGGLGDAFCKINASSGDKKWCLPIGVAVPFITTDKVSFVVATDNQLYAIRNSDGAIYWHTTIEKQTAPVYDKKTITVGRQKINAETGKIITK